MTATPFDLDAAWWPRLCTILRRLKADPGYLVTPATKSRNHILAVDELGGAITLMSERSRSGEPRTITASQIRNGREVTTNGVIVRALLDLAASDEAPASPWHGPYRVRDLLDRCIDDDQDWPTDDGLVYVVTVRGWTSEPTHEASPLYVGGTTGASGRFVTRIGDLIADMFGFYGTTSGHSSGGQHLYEYVYQQRLRPGDLYLGWLHDTTACRRCAEVEWHDRLRPELNRILPPGCGSHPRKARR